MERHIDFVIRCLNLLDTHLPGFEVLRVAQDNVSFGNAFVDVEVGSIQMRFRRERGELLADILPTRHGTGVTAGDSSVIARDPDAPDTDATLLEMIRRASAYLRGGESRK